MALTLTDRMVVAIVANDRKVFQCADLLETMARFKLDHSVNNMKMVLSRDFRQKGWVERLGKTGQETNYAPTMKLYQDNYQHRLFILEHIQDKPFKKDVLVKWQNKMNPKRLTEAFNPPKITESKPKKKRATYAGKVSVSSVKITRKDLILAIAASKVKSWSGREIQNTVEQILNQTLPHWAISQPIGDFKRAQWIEKVDNVGATPLYKCTKKFFEDLEGKKKLFCDAIPEREDRIKYNFDFFLSPGEVDDIPEEEEAAAPPAETTQEKEVAPQPDEQAAPHPSVLPQMPDVGMPNMPASYVIGKCVVDYLSMVSTDPLPLNIGGTGGLSTEKTGEDDEDKTKLNQEMLHHIEHSTAEIKDLTQRLESIKSKNKVLSHRLEESLRENAGLKTRVGQMTMALEKLQQGCRTRKATAGGNGNGNGAEKEDVPPAHQTTTVIRRTNGQHAG